MPLQPPVRRELFPTALDRFKSLVLGLLLRPFFVARVFLFEMAGRQTCSAISGRLVSQRGVPLTKAHPRAHEVGRIRRVRFVTQVAGSPPPDLNEVDAMKIFFAVAKIRDAHRLSTLGERFVVTLPAQVVGGRTIGLMSARRIIFFEQGGLIRAVRDVAGWARLSFERRVNVVRFAEALPNILKSPVARLDAEIVARQAAFRYVLAHVLFLRAFVSVVTFAALPFGVEVPMMVRSLGGVLEEFFMALRTDEQFVFVSNEIAVRAAVGVVALDAGLIARRVEKG